MADNKEVLTGLPEKTAGAAPVDASQRHGSSVNNARVPTPHKGNAGTLHWFAFLGQEACSPPESKQVGENFVDEDAHRPGVQDTLHGHHSASLTDQGKDGGGLSQKEREERIRQLRERQNEERLRKLEDLKSQALAAQKFREQKEEERRRRIDELRSRDSDRRYQVEERKRQIWEAERDRREAILRKNQEREARVDTKRRNERSSIVFAFGSSTPRMLEPADTGGSFWGTRRATSTSNVMMFSAVPLTRRSSERELDGSKKRAASASGLDRKPEEGDDVDAGTGDTSARVHRKKTDLMPTIPSPRDTTPSRPPSSSANRPFSRTPGRAFSMSRLDQLSKPRRPVVKELSEKPSTQPSTLGVAPSSVSRSMSHLVAAEGKPRTALRKNEASRSMSQLAPAAPPVPPPRLTRAERLRKRAREVANNNREKGLRSGEITPRPMSAMSQQSGSSVNTSSVSLRHRPTATPRKPRPFSIAVTGVTQEDAMRPAAYRHSISGEIRSSKAMAASVERIESTKPPIPKPHVSKKPASAPAKPETPARRAIKSAKTTPRATPKATPLQSPGVEFPPSIPHEQPDTKNENKVEDKAKEEVKVEATSNEVVNVNTGPKAAVVEEIKDTVKPEEAEVVVQTVQEPEKPVEEVLKPVVVDVQLVEKEEKTVEPPVDKMSESLVEKVDEDVDMSASMMAKTRITTEEEAKAALAERRRLAREQAEREAEMERQRIEEERRAEEERQRIEEEEQIKFEEEQLRLVEEARRAEEERLLLAIQENERQQEEEKKRKEEEAKAKLEREEADKKAREEADRLRQEMDERLRKEEEERVTRRKRVEAIMLRTRGKGNTPANTPTKDGDSEGDEGKDMSPSEETKSDIQQSAMLAASSADNHVEVDNGHDEFNGQENGGSNAKSMATSASSEMLLIDNTNGKPMEISDEDLTSDRPTNGHRNGGVEYNNSVDFVNVDNMKQNNTSNNLLDFSEFESLSNVDQSSTSTMGMDQILTPTSGKFINEDNVNSNIMNGPNAPFIAFSDNMTKKQDSNTVSDLLS